MIRLANGTPILAQPSRAVSSPAAFYQQWLTEPVAVRRGEQSGARLKMEQERLEREREKTEEELVEHFERWARNPKLREVICDKSLTEEEKRQRMRELFGLPLEPPETAATDEPGSKPTQLSSCAKVQSVI